MHLRRIDPQHARQARAGVAAAAPRTVAAMLRWLPFHERVIHVRWSGEAVWVPLGNRDPGVGFENHTGHPSAGDVLLYPGGYSETYPHTRWEASAAHVHMAPPAPAPRLLRIASTPQQVTLDLARSALMIIDMQNDFCTQGGWVDHLGADYRPDRAPIAPLQRLLPAWRGAGGAVIWVNWGNRADLANMPPNQHHLYKPSGQGIGLGEPLPGHGARVLQKDSWAAAVVDELEIAATDLRVDKHRISGFWDTPLDSILRNLGTRTLLFAGVNTDQCVLHTLTDANFLGYGCVLLQDCCATTSPAFCTEATLWNVRKCFGFVAGSQEVLAALG